MTDAPPDSTPGPPAPSLARGFLRNAATGFGLTVVLFAINFAFVPYVVHAVGDERYGLWLLAFALAQYTTILDAGFLAAVRRFQSDALARRDVAAANEVLAISLRVYGVVGVLAWAVCLSAIAWLPRLVDVPADHRDELTWALVVAGASTCIGFLRSCFNGVLFGANRTDLERMVALVERVFVAALTVLLIETWRRDLVAPSLGYAAGGVLALAYAFVLARRTEPDLRPRLGIAPESRGLVASMLAFSATALFLSASGLTIEHAPKFVIGALRDPAAVTHFGMPLLLVSYFFQGAAPISGAVFPLTARLHARGGAAALRDFYVRAARAMTSLAIAGAVPLAFYGGDFLRHWVGPDYAPMGRVLAILILAEALRTGQMTGLHLLMATGRIGPVSVGQAVNAAAALAGTWLALRTPGGDLANAAWALAIPGAVFWAIYVPWSVTRQVELPFGAYCARALPRPLAVAALLALVCAAATHVWTPPGLATTIATLAVLGGVGLVLVAGLGLDGADRAQLLAALRRRRGTGA